MNVNGAGAPGQDRPAGAVLGWGGPPLLQYAGAVVLFTIP